MSYSNYIPVSEIKLGHTYKVEGRNFHIGVAHIEWEYVCFVGIRYKLQSTYLFSEVHWDEGPDIGTAKPISEIEKCPIENINIDSPELFSYLEKVEQEYANRI